jgi:hypothetical protein
MTNDGWTGPVLGTRFPVTAVRLSCSQQGVRPSDCGRYLQVVVHPGPHKLPEGVVHALPAPAVDDHALSPKADAL